MPICIIAYECSYANIGVLYYSTYIYTSIFCNIIVQYYTTYTYTPIFSNTIFGLYIRTVQQVLTGFSSVAPRYSAPSCAGYVMGSYPDISTYYILVQDVTYHKGPEKLLGTYVIQFVKTRICI